MQTDVFLAMMQWSSPCWELLTPRLQIWRLISVGDKENTDIRSWELSGILILHDLLFKPNVHFDLHIRRDVGVAAVHRFHRASAVVAVIITAWALSCVHRQRDSTVQVLISPGGHMRVSRFAGIWLWPAPKHRHTHTGFSTYNLIHRDQSADSQRCVGGDFIYLLWLSVLCRRGFILRAGISFWGDSCWAD